MIRSRIRAHPTAVVAALLAILAGTAATGSQAAAKGSPPRPLYWGAQIGAELTGEAAPWDMGAVSAFEGATGKPLSLISFAAPFADCKEDPCSFYGFPTTPLENVRAYGAIPVFNWSSGGSLGSVVEPSFQLSRIIDGGYDGYIREFAEAAREWGHPFFLRFNWEMNGFWFPWSEGVNGNQPGEYVAAWRHVHNIFTSVGAINATWVWCPNVDFTRKLTPLKGLYPGDAYVDWTGLDGFNWGDTRNSAGWQTFDEVFRSTYKRVVKIAPSKPMVIGEIASEERGGSKPRWIRQMLNTVPKSYPRLRALVWFEEPDQGMHWPIRSSTASANAFARGISRGVYKGNVYSGLVSLGPILPPTW